MFEKASRLRLRFASPLGLLAIEDLWQLPLISTAGKANLDDIARALHIKLKGAESVSFVEPSTGTNEIDQLKFDVVKHVIDVKLAENALAAQARAKREMKQRMLEIIERKEGDALSALSIDELRQKLNAL